MNRIADQYRRKKAHDTTFPKYQILALRVSILRIRRMYCNTVPNPSLEPSWNLRKHVIFATTLQTFSRAKKLKTLSSLDVNRVDNKTLKQIT